MPLTRNAIIDRDAALNLIDELRVAVPEEVRAAKRINQEGERIIEKAQEEAERIVARAQEQAAFLINERGLTEAADDESRRIIAIAEEEAAERPARRRRLRRRACSPGLEADVTRTLRSIERGIAMLDDRRAAHAPPVEPSTTATTTSPLADAGDGRRRGGGLGRRPAMSRPDPARRTPSTRSGDPLDVRRCPASWPRRPAPSASTPIDAVDVDPGDGLVLTEPVAGHAPALAHEPRPRRRRAAHDRHRGRVRALPAARS